jgi:hypothetical protein
MNRLSKSLALIFLLSILSNRLFLICMINCSIFSDSDAELFFGFVDKKGVIKIVPKYDKARDFIGGVAFVVENDQSFYIDKNDNQIIALNKDYGYGDFYEGLAAVYNKGFTKGKFSKTGFININGEIIIEPQFLYAKDFSERLSAVKISFKSWGFINKKGNIVIHPKYIYVHSFSEGLAAVKTFEDWVWDKNISSDMMVKKMKWGFIDTKGELVIKDKFCEVESFSEGLALVSEGCYFSPKRGGEKFIRGKYGYINKKGKYVIKPKFRWAGSFSEGLAAVLGDKGWGFIDKKGKRVIKFKYERVRPFKEGLAEVRIDKKWGFINQKGKIIISPKFNDVRSFSEGYAAVEVDGLWGYVDKAGKYLVEPKFLEAYPFTEGLARVKVAVAKKKE